MHHTPLNIADFAISKCWDKPCDMDNVNTEKINRIANKFKHASTIEHITYNFEIKGVSRALLQELARHRMANLSVKSTRYTLKELRTEEEFFGYTPAGRERASKYVVLPPVSIGGNGDLACAIIEGLENLRVLIASGMSNDLVKYCLPEAYKTELVWTCNARALQNFLHLRSNKSALWEIRDLAKAIFEAIPDDHKFLFEESMYKEKEK